MRYCCTVFIRVRYKQSPKFLRKHIRVGSLSKLWTKYPVLLRLALQQNFDWLIGVPKEKVHKKSNNVEIVFEERDFDGFLQKLKGNSSIAFLGEVVEHDWGQRVIRFLRFGWASNRSR